MLLFDLIIVLAEEDVNAYIPVEEVIKQAKQYRKSYGLYPLIDGLGYVRHTACRLINMGA
jgi:hypothetical protein